MVKLAYLSDFPLHVKSTVISQIVAFPPLPYTSINPFYICFDVLWFLYSLAESKKFVKAQDLRFYTDPGSIFSSVIWKRSRAMYEQEFLLFFFLLFFPLRASQNLQNGTRELNFSQFWKQILSLLAHINSSNQYRGTCATWNWRKGDKFEGINGYDCLQLHPKTQGDNWLSLILKVRSSGKQSIMR